jgi:hypothetical protein
MVFDDLQMFLRASDGPVLEAVITSSGLFLKHTGHKGMAARVALGAQVGGATLAVNFDVLAGPNSTASDATVVARHVMVAADASNEFLIPFACDDEYVFLSIVPTGSTSDLSVAIVAAGLVYPDDSTSLKRTVDWTTS